MKCECGCGQEVNFGKRFRQGHHARVNNPFKGVRLLCKKNPFWGKKHNEETIEHLRKINTGKKHSKKTKMKIGEIHKGKIVSDETRKNMSKAQKGKTFSMETREKMSESRKVLNLAGIKSPLFNAERQRFPDENQGKFFCQYCGEPIVIKIWHYNDGIPNYCSKECRGKDAVGDKNPNWRNGISSEPYCQKFTLEVKEKIREQYNRSCVICGKSEIDNNQRLCIHHVDYNKNQGCDGHEWKLVPLCRVCHSKTNGNRDQWEEVIMNKLELIF